MTVTLVVRVLPVRAVASMALAAGLLLAAALAGVVPPLLAVALAGGGAAVLPGAGLICLGLSIRSAYPGSGACKCAGMLGLGVLAGGVSVAVLPAADPAARPLLAAAGLAVTSVLFMLGLLQAPAIAPTLLARLRLALDGICIGLLLTLAGWLMFPELSSGQPLAYAAAMVATTCAAITAAAVVRARRYRPELAGCGAGAALMVTGLALLVATVGPGLPAWAMLLATGLVVTGPPVMWVAASRIDFAPAAAADGGAASLDETVGGYPMLALPVVTAVAATAYHLVMVGLPDHTAVLLSIVAGTALAVREVLAASDLRRRAGRLAAQEAHLRALVAGTGDVTMVLDQSAPDQSAPDLSVANLVVRWQSPAARQFGLADHEVVGRRFLDLLHPEDRAATARRLRSVLAGTAGPPVLIEARMIDGGGGWRETESTVTDLRGVAEVAALVVQVRDIGQRRHLERTVQLLASTDQRTGLPNRQELVRAVTARRAVGYPRGAVIVVALPGLAAVNAHRGRAAGDAVVVEAARRLRAHAGLEDVVARLEGSEFAVVTAEGPIEAYALATRLARVLARPYSLPGRPAELATTVGLAPLAGGESAEHVLHRADLALRRAGRLGGAQVEWYDESLEEQQVRRQDLERHLPGAAGRGELDLVYQPVVELFGRQPVGVEALLRWRHPVLGRVPPAELMPVADQLRVSDEIGEWVLHAACRQVGAWRREGNDLWLAVNVSAQQLADPELVPNLAAALSVHGTPPERLTLEVAETEVGPNLALVAAALGQVRGLGIRAALGDVGAGHTDLAWLRRLPLDVIKLAPVGADLAMAVVELAERLGLTVVAEKLETEAQYEQVRAAGCRYGQGYLVAPPAPAERLEAYLASAQEAAAGGVETPAAGPSSPEGSSLK